jgi:hypothetical protein
VDLNVDRFIQDMESVMKRQGFADAGSDGDVDIEEGSSSDFDMGKLYTVFTLSLSLSLYC